jgi:hypothetical protein
VSAGSAAALVSQLYRKYTRRGQERETNLGSSCFFPNHLTVHIQRSTANHQQVPGTGRAGKKWDCPQELSLAGVWMVPPHMKLQSDNAVVADKRPEGLLTPVFNVWRLLRHLFLPI